MRPGHRTQSDRLGKQQLGMPLTERRHGVDVVSQVRGTGTCMHGRTRLLSGAH